MRRGHHGASRLRARPRHLTRGAWYREHLRHYPRGTGWRATGYATRHLCAPGRVSSCETTVGLAPIIAEVLHTFIERRMLPAPQLRHSQPITTPLNSERSRIPAPEWLGTDM
ncbi:hypothetical protein NDU88_006811 [Pleurodeles waltl]|uniref:Uncharacterized protein n=1 Tax=Pleurodeles waltl TaxID=8319 RepID=A0AAV7LT03_PLEWA|nr:hypothetical protein NDU88_006811 [Pleurodeles waltl]